MLKHDQNVFVGFTGESGQTELSPATIMQNTGNADSSFVVRFANPIDEATGEKFAAGSTVGIFFEHKTKFMRQDARIDAVISADDKFTVGITTTGHPVSAEGRACYRATTVTDNIRATVNGNDVCQVLDVSATGCSVRSNKSYTLGDTIDIAIEHLGKRYVGTATVQGVKTLGTNDYRYGLCSVGSAPSATSLHNGLQTIFATVQRNQLKRLAGAA